MIDEPDDVRKPLRLGPERDQLGERVRRGPFVVARLRVLRPQSLGLVAVGEPDDLLDVPALGGEGHDRIQGVRVGRGDRQHLLIEPIAVRLALRPLQFGRHVGEQRDVGHVRLPAAQILVGVDGEVDHVGRQGRGLVLLRLIGGVARVRSRPGPQRRKEGPLRRRLVRQGPDQGEGRLIGLLAFLRQAGEVISVPEASDIGPRLLADRLPTLGPLLLFLLGPRDVRQPGEGRDPGLAEIGRHPDDSARVVVVLVVELGGVSDRIVAIDPLLDREPPPVEAPLDRVPRGGSRTGRAVRTP